MSFKFNFSQDSCITKEALENKSDYTPEPPSKKWCPGNHVNISGEEINPGHYDSERKVAAEELQVTSKHHQIIKQSPKCCVKLLDGSTLQHTDGKAVQQQLEEEPSVEGRTSTLQAVWDQNSDLVPHVYEGGLKVWECSVDLTNYLSGLQVALRGLKVLELGCGAGLPGIWAYRNGADITFQDYNWEALHMVTIPNVLLNTHEDDRDKVTSRCRFISGDWTAVQELLLKDIKSDSDKFDIILTSETIYSPENFQDLHEIMRHLLKKSGTIYLAAKTFYFGVGGGTRQFEDHMDKEGMFTSKVCQEFTEGVKREILKITFKETSS